MRHVIVYHDGCNDGFCAAWIADRAIRASGGVTLLWPTGYGQPTPPLEPGAIPGPGWHWHILDFSYPPDVLQRIADSAASVVMLDHHAGAARHDYSQVVCPSGTCHTLVDQSRSGAMLADAYYRPNAGGPSWVTRYVQDRDLWRWELPYSREINANLASYWHTVEEWDSMSTNSADWHIAQGQAILRAQARYVDDCVRRMRLAEVTLVRLYGDEEVFEHLLIVVAQAGAHWSEVCEAMIARGRDLFGIGTAAVWGPSNDAKRWKVSVRGDRARDIAEAFGGGGHDHAAGFTVQIDSSKDNGGLPWKITEGETRVSASPMAGGQVPRAS